MSYREMLGKIEGPPSPRDMEILVRDLITKDPNRACLICDQMQTWWIQNYDDDESTRRFMWWIGFNAAANALLIARDERRRNRVFRLRSRVRDLA